MRTAVAVSLTLLLAACGGAPDADAERTAAEPTTAESDIGAAIDAALAGTHRAGPDRERDRYRHPKETLTFFGLRPDMTVVELYPGAGWYTGVLAPVLRGNGKLIVAQFPATAPPDYRPRVVASYRQMLTRPVYEGVEMVTLDDDGMLNGVPDASVDMVLTFRNLHNWMVNGDLDTVLSEVARVLKPGGVFGVVEHRANEGVDPAESARTGYVPESFAIEAARTAGLELDARSEINANPADTKDYQSGVWALPPSLRGDPDRREEMLAIGESDRMTLRFVKP